jgi:mono/diheme cytochrome c family protein
VKPIFDRACAECHHPGGRSPDLSQPPTSAGVDQILSVAGGSSPAMPPAPRDPLSQDDLNAISAWRNAGLNP